MVASEGNSDLTASSPETGAHPRLVDALASCRILPVLGLGGVPVAVGVDLIRTLADSGFAAVEITLRSPDALEVVEAVAKVCPDLLVGVGTVLRPEQLEQAAAAGARFAVSPGLTTALSERGPGGAEVVPKPLAAELPLIPGVATPSEAMQAAERGFDLLKLFPATVVGGLGWLRAIRGPLAHLRFCPTGGLGPANYRDFLACANVVCVGGSWMVDRELLAARDWAALGRTAGSILEQIAAGSETKG